ncbi:unnamed protein product, partial [Leptidea sinapis]
MECLSGKLPSPPLSIMKVNMKRGGNFDSGPIGLSQLDDTIVTTQFEQSNCDTSPREYNSKYTSIDLSKAEGSNSVQFQSTVSKHSTDDSVTRADRGIKRVATESSCTSSKPNGQLGATAQIRSYAGVAKVHNPKEGWTVVQKKSQKSKNRLIGKMGNVVVESDEKFRAADRKIPLFITNVHKDTEESDIIKYIENKTQENVSLEKISIKRQCEHDAYKLFVSQSKLPLYPDENRFYHELTQFCLEQEWICVDTELLGLRSETYTFISEAHRSKRWLDHCSTTKASLDSVSNVYVLYDVLRSDRFPLVVECNLIVLLPKKVCINTSLNEVYWGKRSLVQINTYERECHERLRLIDFPHGLQYCCDHNCNDSEHRNAITKLYSDIV